MSDTAINIYIKNMQLIYGKLEDDLSCEIFLNRIQWLVSKDKKYIDNIVHISHPDYPVWYGGDEKGFLENINENDDIVLYGAGGFAENVIRFLDENANYVFCDKSEEKQRQGYFGKKVIAPEKLLSGYVNSKILICSNKFADEIIDELLHIGINKDRIVDIRKYFKCGTGDDYFYEDFIKYEKDEVFIDAGSYDLATTADFLKVCPEAKHVYAFEPDEMCYARCLKRLETFHNKDKITLINKGTWSSETELHFNATNNGSSSIGDGDSIIKTAAIDNIVDANEKVTYIKMDVEGAELESLKGASQIIRRDKPKLAICIYHKPEDIIELPMYIYNLVSEYKYYIRSYSNADNELILYAIP